MNHFISPAFIDGLGGPEVLMIAFVALVLFGGKNLPSLARTMGKTMREFKKASSEVEREIRKAIDETPDTDAPARPLATVPQYHSMPTSTPVPLPYPELQTAVEAAPAIEPAPSLTLPPVSSSEASPVAAPAAKPAETNPEIQRHPIEAKDV